MRFLATRSRAQVLGHECFHRIQGGWDYRRRIPQITLDGALGRIWMLLEWRAQERRLAIADALEFRGHRRSLIPGTAERESRLEINEGSNSSLASRLFRARAGNTLQWNTKCSAERHDSETQERRVSALFAQTG